MFLGVSVGAIFSNYQKERVENVCARIGLKPLCYLWERDQQELYDDMIQDGIEAIIIKVAAAGLTTKHLGMTLKEVRFNSFSFINNHSQILGTRITYRSKQKVWFEYLWRRWRIRDIYGK